MTTQSKRLIRLALLEENHRKVKSIMGLSDFMYQELVFETGMSFLEDRYGKGSERTVKHSQCRPYWKWWVSQYHRWETDFLNFYDKHNPTVCDQTLEAEMTSLIKDHLTVDCFRNYLKLIHNEHL